MSIHEQVAKINLERKSGIDDIEANPEMVRIEAFKKFREDRDALNKYIRGLDKYAKDNGGIGLTINGRYDIDAIAQTFFLMQNEQAIIVKSLKEKNKELRRKLEEQEHFKAQFGYNEQYEKWKKAQRTGRTPKTIDWGKYDHLAAAGLAQKDIAQYLNISTNTLRKKLKEREAQKL